MIKYLIHITLFFSGLNALQAGIITIDKDENGVGNNKDTVYFNPFKTGGDMIVNPENNRIYIGNHTFSNACVVQCPPMERKFETGWTWASFPTLERQNDDPIQAIPFLETLDPMPSSMEFWYLYDLSEYSNNIWNPQDVTEIQSSKGYKLNNLGSSTAYLETPGNTLNEDHAISLTTGENWIGYFPMEPRKALDALEGVLDDLDMIKTQDWGCYKEYIAEKGGTVPTWVCAVGPEGFTALTHGDMVVVNATDPTTLVWNQEAPPISKKDAEKTVQYSYTELADYQSIFVEADPDQIDEVGAFVDGQCIGATVVNDSIEEIKAYIPADATGDITLEYYSEGTKSAMKLTEYTILFPETKLDRVIKARNKDRYYRVSLKNTLGIDEDNSSYNSNLQVYPNPSGGQVTFSLSANQKINGTLDVYNSTGVHVKQLFEGALDKGTHTFYLNKQGELPSGVYLYTFKTGTSIKNGKIVIQ